MTKFTFKKHKKEGKYRCFQKDYTDIKLGKQQVGSIAEQEDGTYRMGFIIKATDQHCGWKWIFLKAAAVSEEAARNFITLRADDIAKKYDLHPIN